MRINTPRHRAVLWAAANLSILAMIPAAVFYYQRQLNAGAYPEDADSIAIPIAGIVAWVLALLAPLNIAWWLLLRGYRGNVALNISSRGLRADQMLIAVLGLILGALLGIMAAWSVIDRAPEFTIVLLACSYVTFAMRAAFVASARAKRPMDPESPVQLS
jgi:hypothetical protein